MKNGATAWWHFHFMAAPPSPSKIFYFLKSGLIGVAIKRNSLQGVPFFIAGPTLGIGAANPSLSAMKNGATAG
jgi:hypothetical protein